ncbi:MAG: periplasmic heavy metal sensor [Sphingobacteriales bacterium]|nr:MAG: periplasmic heavy metal sensor [Sphingobacteriales bacterium]
MTKDNFYRIVITLLLLINIGTLAFVWMDRNDGAKPQMHHIGPPHVDEMIIERLKLDDKQIEQFEELKHEHHSQMVEIQRQSGSLHNALFQLLKTDHVDTVYRDSILHRLQLLDKEKELATFDHFQKLRGILAPNQQSNFDDFVEELSRRLLAPLPPGRDR